MEKWNIGYEKWLYYFIFTARLARGTEVTDDLFFDLPGDDGKSKTPNLMQKHKLH